MHQANLINRRCLIADSQLDWQWKGARYEVLECSKATKEGILEGVIVRDWMDGHRSENLHEKFLADAEVLEKICRNTSRDEHKNKKQHPFFHKNI